MATSKLDLVHSGVMAYNQSYVANEYLERKKVAEIARERGVSRVSAYSYRKEALRLASGQFIRLVSTKP